MILKEIVEILLTFGALTAIFKALGSVNNNRCPYCQNEQVNFLHQKDMSPKRRHVSNYRVKNMYICHSCNKTFGKSKSKTLYHGSNN